jgi:exosortase family protein XrtM
MGGYTRIPDAVLVQAVYYYGVVAPGVLIIHFVAPGDQVQGLGNQIVAGSNVLEIVRGCDGDGVFFLLVAAIVAVRGSAVRVLRGVLGATLFVYLLNQARVVLLYFAIAKQRSLFLPLHSYVFPSLFVLLGLIYFCAWAAPSTPRAGGKSKPA